MAKNTSLVLLGYADEIITDKEKSLVDFTTNKIGGKPDWPNGDIFIPKCSLCGLSRLLILQIYAPLENSRFHRTLYIFSCLNAPCSNQSKGWLCIRVQQLEKAIEKDSGGGAIKKLTSNRPQKDNWCTDNDDWGDEEFEEDEQFDNHFNINKQQHHQQQQQHPMAFGDDDDDDDDLNEQNGNVICDNMIKNRNDNRNISDEDEDESNSLSMESDALAMFGNLQVNDDKNANCGAQGGAVGPKAYAEIEAEEEMILIDPIDQPERDLVGLLKKFGGVPTNIEHLSMRSHFISVYEERKPTHSFSEHVVGLMQDYERRNEIKTTVDCPANGASAGGLVKNAEAEEKYEKGIPAHGDIRFHNFLSRIQENPGQILRYSRDALPLLMAPLAEPIPRCASCGGDVLCELQILPTLINTLCFENSNIPAPIEYGNVLIFTCAQNCWDTPDKFRPEQVIVQSE